MLAVQPLTWNKIRTDNLWYKKNIKTFFSNFFVIYIATFAILSIWYFIGDNSKFFTYFVCLFYSFCSFELFVLVWLYNRIIHWAKSLSNICTSNWLNTYMNIFAVDLHEGHVAVSMGIYSTRYLTWDPMKGIWQWVWVSTPPGIWPEIPWMAFGSEYGYLFH